MRRPYTKSGKCGHTVWQRNRYGQIHYPAFIPANPRTPAQQAIRATFAAVSARWRTLTEEQRLTWDAVAGTKKTRYRLGNGPMTGFNYFVKINVARVNRGLPQLDLPPLSLRSPQPAVPSPSAQPPLGPTLFLHANHYLHPLSFILHPSLRPAPT